MNGSFLSGGQKLARYLAKPAGRSEPLPGLILCHGFPTGPIDARHSAGTFPELIDRAANELGWAAMTFTFRGCGDSEGDFSLQSWIDDLRAAIDHLIAESEPSGIWLVGTNTVGLLRSASLPTTLVYAVRRCWHHAPTSMIGPLSLAGSWSTHATSERFARRAFPRTSTSGAASSVVFARPRLHVGSRRGRCW